MEYRNLGRTGVKVSTLCMGCMNFSDKTPEAESVEMIDAALEMGISFLDTANVYDQSEQVVGKALQRDGKRDRVVLVTKVFGCMDDTDVNARGIHRRHIMQACEQSLKRLRTDTIDLYQLHRPMSAIPIDETLRAMDDLIRSGKVRYIGTSCFPGWRLVESLWVARELGLNRFICEQLPYNILERSAEREIIPAAQTYGFALIPWGPLAGGFLTGKYRPGDKRPEGARYETHRGTWYAERNFSDASFAVLKTIEKLAQGKGCSPSQLCLAWCAKQPGITSPIIGPSSMDQLLDNLGTLEVDVTEEDKKQIDQVAPPGKAIASCYEKDSDIDFGPSQFR